MSHVARCHNFPLLFSCFDNTGWNIKISGFPWVLYSRLLCFLSWLCKWSAQGEESWLLGVTTSLEWIAKEAYCKTTRHITQHKLSEGGMKCRCDDIKYKNISQCRWRKYHTIVCASSHLSMISKWICTSVKGNWVLIRKIVDGTQNLKNRYLNFWSLPR